MTNAVTRLPVAPTRPRPDVLLYRELCEPREIVAMLRLRHRVYFEQQRYGSLKPMGLDLTAHDERSRLFGVFAGDELVGGVRFVFRREQRAASIMRAVHAVAEHAVAEQCANALPSEEAFDLSGPLGAHRELVDLEAGRLVALRPGVSPGMVLQIMVATLAVAHLASCRLYLYSCAADLAARYARVTKPRWQLEQALAEGITSDHFTFPRRTVAAVAAIEDSPYLERALTYARELSATGYIMLQPDVSACRGEQASAI